MINHDKKGYLFIKQAGFNGTYLAFFFLVAGDPKLNLCCLEQGTSVLWRPALVGGVGGWGDGSPWMCHTNWDRYFLLEMWRFGVKIRKLGIFFYTFSIFFDACGLSKASIKKPGRERMVVDFWRV